MADHDAPPRGVVTWGPWLVETMGIEPTTPCLQSRIRQFRNQGRWRESAGQTVDPVTATTTE